MKIFVFFFLLLLGGCSSFSEDQIKIKTSSLNSANKFNKIDKKYVRAKKKSLSMNKKRLKIKEIRKLAYRKLGKPYKINNIYYYPKKNKSYKEIGQASWYGSAFHKKMTANGELYDMYRLSAAHRTMPLPSYARVTNLENGLSVIVRVNDRGPYVKGRIIDLSNYAADLLKFTHKGVEKVKVEYIAPAPLCKDDTEYLENSFRK